MRCIYSDRVRASYSYFPEVSNTAPTVRRRIETKQFYFNKNSNKLYLSNILVDTHDVMFKIKAMAAARGINVPCLSRLP